MVSRVGASPKESTWCESFSSRSRQSASKIHRARLSLVRSRVACGSNSQPPTRTAGPPFPVCSRRASDESRSKASHDVTEQERGGAAVTAELSTPRQRACAASAADWPRPSSAFRSTMLSRRSSVALSMPRRRSASPCPPSPGMRVAAQLPSSISVSASPRTTKTLAPAPLKRSTAFACVDASLASSLLCATPQLTGNPVAARTAAGSTAASCSASESTSAEPAANAASVPTSMYPSSIDARSIVARPQTSSTVAAIAVKSSREAFWYGPYHVRGPGQSRQYAWTSRPPAGARSAVAAAGLMCFTTPNLRAEDEAHTTSLYWYKAIGGPSSLPSPLLNARLPAKFPERSSPTALAASSPSTPSRQSPSSLARPSHASPVVRTSAGPVS
eukprot:scaffold23233_cov30-Tisochrysis_lutea.AAC.4